MAAAFSPHLEAVVTRASYLVMRTFPVVLSML